MNIIEFFDNLKLKEMFKGLLCLFLIVINIKIVNIITIVNMTTIINITKIVFCNEMLIIMSDPLLLLILI